MVLIAPARASARDCGLASLKRAPPFADIRRMFAARQRPLPVREDDLLALRLSLNTPVLATAELASGPARAAIYAHREAGACRLGVVVSPVSRGTPVVYELEGELPDDTEQWSVALDTALSFGESMGFLFDDEILADRSRATLERAAASLRELLAPRDAAPATSPAAGEELGEILLEDELEALAQDGEAGRRAGGDVVEPAFAPGIALSKFRGAPPPPPAPVPVQTAPVADRAPAATSLRGGATLGRVRPVRIRADADAVPRPDPLLRLLADF